MGKQYYWKTAWGCMECGNLSDNPRINFCAACGSSVGHHGVAVKIESSFFSSRIVDMRSDTGLIIEGAFLVRLARILEIEVDGGDSPAAYLADCMTQALANQHIAKPSKRIAARPSGGDRHG